MFSFIGYLIRKFNYEFSIFKNRDRFPQSSIQSPLNRHWAEKLGRYTIIEAGCTLKGTIDYLGTGLYIGNNTLIYNCTEIGNYCSISSDVKIGLVEHPKHNLSTSPLFYSKDRGLVGQTTFDGGENKKVRIGHDVLISSNAMIINGLEIGTGSIIGAGAVVTKDVPPYAIVAGVPAKIIGYRFDQQTIESLLQSAWWQLSPEEIVKLPYLNNVPLINRLNAVNER